MTSRGYNHPSHALLQPPERVGADPRVGPLSIFAHYARKDAPPGRLYNEVERVNYSKDLTPVSARIHHGPVFRTLRTFKTRGEA
jgi:hypothetical protein